jgi:RNA polymerase sigma factor (sigma-70 family)
MFGVLSHRLCFARHFYDTIEGMKLMREHQWLAEQFEANRTHLQAVAYRMLGDLSEADDAVQEAWLHLSRDDRSAVTNLGGYLTTIVARICLDMLRARTSRREESLEASGSEPITRRESESDPEYEALLADSVGVALLIVLDTLTPAERLAFVLHDIFAVPFDEIAPIVERSSTAARQLASRARRRVRGGASVHNADRSEQRAVVDAFLTASRSGDFDALLAVLDPDVVFRGDRTAVPVDASTEITGAPAVAKQFAGRAQGARPILVNGSVGVVVAPRGRLLLVLELTITHGKIAAINVISDPAHLQKLDLAVLGD